MSDNRFWTRVTATEVVEIVYIADNEQGLQQSWNSLIVRQEPLLIKDIKVQVNKQKPKIDFPDQMKHNSDKMTIAPTSSQPCIKPNIVLRLLFNKVNSICIRVNY